MPHSHPATKCCRRRLKNTTAYLLSVVSSLLVVGSAGSARAAGEQSVIVTVKSYIARMGPPADQRTTPPSEATKKALGFERDNLNRTHALLFMYKTDDNFSEDPKTPDSANADFRLWSSVKLTGTCDAQQNISAWFVSALDTKFGKEGSLNAVGAILKPLVVTANGHVVAPTAPDRGPATKAVSLTYAVKGRPSDLTIPFFTAIRPRSCTWIWHEVSVTSSCAGGAIKTDAVLSSSAFPSARLWENRVLKKSHVQGPFEGLWECDDKDHSLVK